VSEGLGADWLKAQNAPALILPFQPHDQFASVLASADVLVAILESDAGVFSVPSKILAYHCAGRAMLCAFPLDNLSARIVRDHGSGLVVAPDDQAGLLAAADQLCDPARRDAMAAKALDYASRTFDIEDIGARFEEALKRAKHS